MKINWLDRRISAPGPYLCLCLSEEEYLAARKHLGSCSTDKWVSDSAHATSHIFQSDKGLCAVICLKAENDYSPIDVAGLLVHEAVHVWQYYCEYIGETEPAKEQEAYAIQAVAQELMAEYARRLGEKK